MRACVRVFERALAVVCPHALVPGQFLEHFGVTSIEDAPATLVLVNAGEDGHYLRAKTTDKQLVTAFVDAVLQGKEPVSVCVCA